MNKNFTLRRATLLLALTLPSLCWGFGTPPNALIVTETGSEFQGDINAVVSFLSGRMVAAGLTPTTSVGVPGSSMAAYKMVWDIRAETPLSGSDITAYVTYMAAGGSLFAMGENGGCCGSRDTSIAALVTAAGGGVVTLEGNSANTQTVHAPFTGPVSLASLTYADIGGFTSPGNGAFITTDTNTSGGSIIFGPGTMSNATTGVLASVLDINFMDTSGSAEGLSQALTDNLLAYLGTPTVIPSSGATSFTMTGPTGGLISAASTNFTVTPNAAYTGTITITPSGGGLSMPIVLTFSASATAQTFTITPSAAGPVTLTATNNGSLTNPTALTYATPPSAPTIGTATPGPGSASVAFTIPGTTGGSPITLYTATCNPGSVAGTGSSSPVTVTGLTPGTAYTCSVTATNARGVSVASAASNQITAGATSFTLTGPTGGAINSASTNFTVTPNAAYTGTITITPAGGGVSTPIVLTFTASAAAQTFTITPTSSGPVTLTASNNGSLTNPAALSYATPPSAPTIGTAQAGPGSASVAFSAPANTGGSAITLYTATCSPGGRSAVGTSSPVTVTGLTSGTAYTCTVTATNSAGAGAASGPSNQITIPPTGFTFTGPASGAINSASGNFTVTPNSSYTGTITITPSGGGLSTPIVLTFSGSTAQTFTITPTSAGPVTLTPSNSNSLVNPTALTYATPPAAPTIGTATASPGAASVAFTPGSTGGLPVTSYTATCNPGGISATGSSSPIAVTGLAAGAYTCTVTATNSAGVSAASAASNQVTVPGAGYTITGPAGGLINNVSSVFTITPNTAFTGTITISVSGGGATAAIMRKSGNSPGAKGGRLAAIVRSFSNSSLPQTFTVTPTSVGPVTITATNNASLIDPAALFYDTQPGAPVIGTATASGGSVVVTFTPPASGGSPITGYTATCTGGATATGTSSPLTVTGISPGGSVTCTVTASNLFGVSAASNPSNQVTPAGTPTASPTPAPASLGLITIGAAALFLWNRRRTLKA